MPYGYESPGVSDYIHRMNQVPLRAQPSPPSQTEVRPGYTKEDLGASRAAMSSRRMPPRGGRMSPSTAAGAAADDDALILPGDEGFQDEVPDKGIIEYSLDHGENMQRYDPTIGLGNSKPGSSLDAVRNRGFMGHSGLSNYPNPHGGGRPGPGFTPSQTDFSKVANPEAFDAYNQPVRDNERAAAIERSRRDAENPLWEEQGKADIWTGSQIDVATGIRDEMLRRYQGQVDAAIAAVKNDPRYTTPEAKEAAANAAIDRIKDSFNAVIGTRGVGTAAPSGLGDVLR